MDRPAPLIVTLLLDAASQERFDALRAAHFPPSRNHLSAHVTLFHALPGEAVAEVLADLRSVARREPFDVDVTGLRFLGRGVAYVLRSPELEAVRGAVAAGRRAALSPQDRQRFAPHVTVQNSTDPAVARALQDELSASFVPWTVRGRGLGLWRYAGGPWEVLDEVEFSPE